MKTKKTPPAPASTARETWAAYVRVSTDEQADRKTHQAQREAIARWAKAYGHELVWFEDLGVSGRTMNRPNWVKMMAALADGPPTLAGVVAAAMDRISRASIYDFFSAAHNILALDKAIVTIRESTTMKPDDLYGQLVGLIWATFGAAERKALAERTTAGHAAARARGVKYGRPRKQFDVNLAIYRIRERRIALTDAARLVEWTDNRGRHGTGIAPNILRARIAEADKSATKGATNGKEA